MLRRVGLVALLAYVAASCSNPPTKEHDQAVAALNAARAADASTYAPDEFEAAQSALTKYDEAVEQRDYRQALSDAIDARDRGFEAARQAGVQKAAARAELEQLLTEVDAELKTATIRLATPGRLPPARAERLRTAVHDVTPALQEARSAFNAQKYRDGLTRLRPPADALKKAAAPAEPGRRGRGAT